MSIVSRILSHLNPAPNPNLDTASSYWNERLPILWLLGKTGAGKSSLIRAVTGDTEVEIGNGFRPCTQFSFQYDFPTAKPVLRFLDTRGLSEAEYDASEDIQLCESQSHALVVVMKLDDPEQCRVLSVLKQIQQSSHIKQLLLVHTGLDLLPHQSDRDRCMAHNREQVQRVWADTFEEVMVDLSSIDEDLADNEAPVEHTGTEQGVGIETFKAYLIDMLPILNQILLKHQKTSIEEQNFEQLKTEILWYSGSAGVSDAIPAVGLVSVPTIQAKMLHSLANQYHLQWDKRLITEFLGTLGASFGIQYLGRLGARQLLKWIPIYGQTLGATSAAVMSFCTTYAMGRVACKYLYHKANHESVSEDEMKRLYQLTFDQIRAVKDRESNSK